MTTYYYPKTHNLYERDPNTRKLKIGPGFYTNPLFANVEKWEVEEKIDGTNLLIRVDPETGVTFHGRSENSILQPKVVAMLEEKINKDKLMGIFKEGAHLYGEGFGGNIQARGKLYSKEIDFCLYDIRLREEEEWRKDRWLDREEIRAFGSLLNLRTPTHLKHLTHIDEIIEFVRSCPPSEFRIDPKVLHPIEGVIARDAKCNQRKFKLKLVDLEC